MTVQLLSSFNVDDCADVWFLSLHSISCRNFRFLLIGVMTPKEVVLHIIINRAVCVALYGMLNLPGTLGVVGYH